LALCIICVKTRSLTYWSGNSENPPSVLASQEMLQPSDFGERGSIWMRNDQCTKWHLSLSNIRPLEIKKWAFKSTVLYVVTDPPCASDKAICDVIMKEARWAFFLAKMAAWEEKYYHCRKSEYFYIKPAGALCRGGISKTFDGCNIISKCACGAPTGGSVGCDVGLYIHKALSRWRDSVDMDVGKIPLRYVRLLG